MHYNEFIFTIAMEAERYSKNSLLDLKPHNYRVPSYSELKNRVEQLEHSVAKLIRYPADVLLRMRHVITTRYKPYSFQSAHYSPSPEFSPSPSPLGYSPNPSPLGYNHSPKAVSATECRLNEPLVDLTNFRDNIQRYIQRSGI